MPVTTPPELTVPFAGVLLLHTPPVAALDKVTVLPSHTALVPVMIPADGLAFTVIDWLTASLQSPVVTVYVIVVVPADKPLTTPVLLMVATAGLLLIHTPPVVVLLNASVLPSQTAAPPLIVPADGLVFTVVLKVVASEQPEPVVTM